MFRLMAQIDAQYDKVDPTGVVSTTIYRDSSFTNVLTNTAYLLVFGDNTAPTKLQISFQYATKGEFVRLAIPYPASTTFTFTPPRMMVTSFDQLTSTTYFYDTTKNLLWVHVEIIKESYRYDDGLWTIDSNTRPIIVADCKGSCLQEVDYKTVTLPSAVKETPIVTVCEEQGNILGGAVTNTMMNGAKEWVIFDETVDPLWRFDTSKNVWELTNEMAASKQSSIKVTLNQTSFVLTRANWQDSGILEDGYTHLAFEVRASLATNLITLYLTAANKSTGMDGNLFGISLPDPRLSLSPIDSQQWHSIYIPLSSLGIGSTPNLSPQLWSLWFSTTWGSYINASFYIDNIRLTSVNTQYVPVNRAKNFVDTNYDYFKATSQTTTPPDGSASSVGTPTTSNEYSWAVPVVVVLAILLAILILVIIVMITRGNNESF
eukprot:TRINITY_DN347_c0_g2_i7.p1 TRINITY_DN347_c0_g2~~TRINITY_DN347_c0_g2_i7.p1  ORF type:complete len:456 (-),score=89.03 TRINITY_DN347_c0_g2_i7:309-1604(-)